MKTLKIFSAIFSREIRVVFKNKTDWLTTISFFVLVVSLFPFTIKISESLLHTIGAGVIWISALLAFTLSNSRLFLADFIDGSLEQLFLSPIPSTWIVLAKVVVNWVFSGLVLLLLSPILAIQFGLGLEEIKILMISLLIGTPILSLFGALSAALTLGSRGGGGLVAILSLPLYIPVLVFGVGAVTASYAGLSPVTSYYVLLAILLLGLVFLPYVIAATLKIAME